MEPPKQEDSFNSLSRLIMLLVICVLSLLICFSTIVSSYFLLKNGSISVVKAKDTPKPILSKSDSWTPPTIDELTSDSAGRLISYGRELVLHTSIYLGPKGSVKPISNGMNCKNCHLEGGTKMFGINFSAVASNYPIWRDRSGSNVDVKERINECIERSLNGTRLEESSNELEAMAAYILWIGKDVPKGSRPLGVGLKEIALLDRPANPINGKVVFQQQCLACHDEEGKGLVDESGLEWTYPPIFGNDSYNQGAGLYRLSKFASFVKYNMPYGISYKNPVLTDEEAWDVAAYVNSLPRPEKDQRLDWPDLGTKPLDHPFGPYADDYSELDHKYGPYQKMKR